MHLKLPTSPSRARNSDYQILCFRRLWRCDVRMLTMDAEAHNALYCFSHS
jgi:hypothetical protein